MNDCRHKRPAKCTGNGFVFRKVVIPASLGDDITGQDKPENGAYTNSYVEYEANGAQYMYDSGGIYTKIEGGGGKGVSDFNELENRPKYAGEEMTGDTDIPDFSDDIAAEADARAAADTSLSGQIANKQNKLTQTQLDAVNSGIDDAKVGQIATNTTEISSIEEKIPVQASSSNQLADKNFVNSSIATNTAYYISDNGQPFQSLADLEAYSGTLTNNDYAFVIGTDSQGNTVFDRYKYNANTQEWAFEYELNNSSFTAEQWASINSGITSGDVSKLGDLANIKTIGSNLSLDANGVLSAIDTTYTDFVGTDGTDAGSAGLVPAPTTGDADKYLKSDGTWDSVSGGIPTNATFWGASYDSVNNRVQGNISLATSASNVNIIRNGNSIYSSPSLRFESGGNVLLTNYRGDTVGHSGIELKSSGDIVFNLVGQRQYETTISAGSRRIINVADPTVAQDAATKNYTDNLVISYASLNASGAPTTATEGKYVGQLYYDTTNEQLYFLKEIDDTVDPVEYTWETIGGSSINVVQTTGTSTTDVMSQAATSQLVYPAGSETNKSRITIPIGTGSSSSLLFGPIKIGTTDTADSSLIDKTISIGYATVAARGDSVVIGTSTAVRGDQSIAIGTNARVDNNNNYSIALGYASRTSRVMELSIGSGAASNGTRFIANVTDPTLPQDAATKNYTDNLVVSYASLNGSAAPTTATVGQYIGQLYYDTTNEDMYYLKAIDTTTTPATYTWDTIGGGGGGIQNALIIREWS